MIEAADILYLVLRLIKNQVSWSVSWSAFELIQCVLIGILLGIKIHAPDSIDESWLGHQHMNN